MRLELGRTPAEAAGVAARLLGALLSLAIRRRGRACLALSGGRSPIPLFQALARQSLEWPAVHLFQVDERVTPRGDSARNLAALEQELVTRGPLPRQNLHPMWVEQSDLERAAASYGEELAALAGRPTVLDAVQLGLGADGHTASLFAGDPALKARGTDVAVAGEHAGYRRMTLTLPLLNRARSVIWFVTGADKAEVLAELMAGGAPFPAARISRRRAVVVADAPAAAGLPARVPEGG